MTKTTILKLYVFALFYLISCCSQFVICQSANSHFGIISGMNISNFNEGRYEDFDFFLPGTGISIGVSYDMKIGTHWEINFESLLSKKIIKEKYSIENDPIYNYAISDYRINHTYLTLPLTINYSFERLVIQSGIFADILLNRSISGINENAELSNMNYTKHYDGGMILGGHYDFYNLEIGLRKFIGMVDQSSITIEDEYFQHNISLYKTAGLQFYLKYNL